MEGRPPRDPWLLRPNPGLGPLCAECGTAVGAPDHLRSCRHLRARRELWEEGWVDLAALGVPPGAAVGWAEVCEGPVAVVVEGGFGPEWIQLGTGPWVRHLGDGSATHQRVAALAVLLAAGHEPLDAVTAVVAAAPATIDAWRRPEVLAIDTTGCGRSHQVVVRRGVAQAVNHRHSASHRVDRSIPRSTSAASCAEVVERWERADAGRVVGDLTEGAVPRYDVVGADPGVAAAMAVLRAAVRVRARTELLVAGEPDRWLHLDVELVPAGEPATLHASTRPIPAALVRCPPTWLWSSEPLR